MASHKMTERWYDDACGVAHALELLGERWALLIVRELLLGSRRFGELRRGLPGISANTLARRLDGLVASGIVSRGTSSAPGSAPLYALTGWGGEVEPAMRALGRWAMRSPDHDPTLPLSASAAMLSLPALVEAGRVRRPKLRLAVRLDGEPFVVRLRRGTLRIRRGESDRAEAMLDTDPATFAAIVHGRRPLAAAEAEGAASLSGDRGAVQAFVDLFAPPAKAEVDAGASSRLGR